MILVLTFVASAHAVNWNPFASSSPSQSPQTASRSLGAKTEDQITVANDTSSYIVTVAGTRDKYNIQKQTVDAVIDPSAVKDGLILPVGQQMTIFTKNKLTGKEIRQTISRKSADDILYVVKVSLGSMKVEALNRGQAELQGYSISYK